MLSGIGPGSLLLILVIVLLLFGTRKLRNIGGDLGNAIKSFRSAVREERTEQQDEKPHALNQDERHQTDTGAAGSRSRINI